MTSNDSVEMFLDQYRPSDEQARALETLAPDDDQPQVGVLLMAAHLIRLGTASEDDQGQQPIRQLVLGTLMVVITDISMGHKPVKDGLTMIGELLLRTQATRN